MIEIINLFKSFNRLSVLESIELKLKEGECIALIGPNGCGKTTLIKCILGMVLPSSGDVLFKGQSVLNAYLYRSHIGYMPQVGKYPENMSVGQIFKMVKGIRNTHSELDEDLYKQFNIESILYKRMSTLSGGTMQKVSAALAFLFNPDVLILDEPTAGLDPLASELLKEKILVEKSKGKLILITSHLLSELDDMVSQIVFMQEGKIVFHKNVEVLKEETHVNKISKAIVHYLKQDLHE
jgi:Cu-processing system ATP-binding protein